MHEPAPPQPRPLPRWLACGLGTAIALHLAAIGLLVLSAPSGPWPTPEGPSQGMPPYFSQKAGATITNHYLAPLKFTHNYHFLRNRPGQPGVFFEARLKDESGREMGTLRIPHPDANPWVRHRQSILAQHLADDQPVQPPAGEFIPAPRRVARVVEIWDLNPDQSLTLRGVYEHLLARDRVVYRPSSWSMILARSYARHIGQTYGATSVQIIRHTREPVPPSALLVPEPAPTLFHELKADFGELRK